MPCLAHDRLATASAHQRRQVAAALHVEDDAGARAPQQHIAREQHHGAIRPDDLAFLGHHAEAVAIAVEGHAHIRALGAHGGDQIRQVGGLGGVRVVVGKRAVHFRVEGCHLATHRLQQARRNQAGDAVAAVRHHLQRARSLHVAHHALKVALDHFGALQLAAAGAKVVRVDSLAQALNALLGQRRAADQHLQAVVFGRIVRAGDHHAGAGLQHLGGVVEERRGHAAHVHHIDAALAQPA